MLTYDPNDLPSQRTLSPLYNTHTGLLTKVDRELQKDLDASAAAFTVHRRELPKWRRSRRRTNKTLNH
jgi:hypothetical protein